MKDKKNADTHLFLLLFTTSQHRKKMNKKSHWFQVSWSKLLVDYSGKIKMPNGLFGQNLETKDLKQKKRTSLSSFTCSK